MRYKSGKKPVTVGKFTPKLRGPKPAPPELLEKDVGTGKTQEPPGTVTGQNATGFTDKKRRAG